MHQTAPRAHIGNASAKHEAEILYDVIIRTGGTVEATRELIAVPPKLAKALRLFDKQHPEDARGIEKVPGFRKRVLEEFDRMVCQSESLTQAAPGA